MVNPYHSPALHEPDGGDSRVASASLIALLSFGLLPAAMIVVRMIVAVTYSERDWDWSIWVWAVGPPLYLSASWMFAIDVRRRGTINPWGGAVVGDERKTTLFRIAVFSRAQARSQIGQTDRRLRTTYSWFLAQCRLTNDYRYRFSARSSCPITANIVYCSRS